MDQGERWKKDGVWRDDAPIIFKTLRFLHGNSGVGATLIKEEDEDDENHVEIKRFESLSSSSCSVLFCVVLK